MGDTYCSVELVAVCPSEIGAPISAKHDPTASNRPRCSSALVIVSVFYRTNMRATLSRLAQRQYESNQLRWRLSGSSRLVSRSTARYRDTGAGIAVARRGAADPLATLDKSSAS